MKEKQPNKIAEKGDFYDPEYDASLEFQDKVLSCLSDVRMYNSHIARNSEALERTIKQFRTFIHGEDTDE
jgi:hypothetical protein